MLPMLAAAVDKTGRVVGIDISPDQIAAANALCADTHIGEAAVHDVKKLPYSDGSFDAVVAIQVIEYLDQPSEAWSELRRVCSVGCRIVILAANWHTMFWNGPVPELTARVQAAWRQHAPYPNLPAVLRPLLADAGFRMIRQSPVSIINNAYHEDTWAYWAARLILAFARGRNLISQTEADDWLEQLEKAQAAGTFFLSLTAVLTIAVVA